jgi:peroxiredoxin
MTVPYSARVSRFRKPVRLALALLVIVGASGIGCGDMLPPASPFAARGDVVDLTLPLLDGGEVDLGSLRGQPVVIHFFTTWSLTAQADLDELRAARKADGAQVKLLSIGLDLDGYQLIAPYRDAAGIDWLVALPTADVSTGKSVFGDVMASVPSTVLLDDEGRVAWVQRGPLPHGALTRQLATVRAHR